MQRRQFNSRLIGAMAAIGLSTGHLTAATPPAPRKRLLPRALKPGDTIGLITPGSYISDSSLQKAVTNLESLGFSVKMGANIRAQRGFTAGADAERLADLHAMFADPSVAGVWCARGGYGCSRLLPYMDYELIKKNPKVLIGYSDITALLQAVYRYTGLVGFHGPVGASDFSDYTRAQCLAVISEGKAPYEIPLAEGNNIADNVAYEGFVVQGGEAEGLLAGGNLSLLAALAGTPYDLDPRGKLIFIEEIGEKPYRIDRMLTQLRQSWPLNAANGIALGVFEDCQPESDDLSLSLADTLRDRLAELKLPCAYGLSFGHIAHQCTLPIGIRARFDAEKRSLTLLEPAVSQN